MLGAFREEFCGRSAHGVAARSRHCLRAGTRGPRGGGPTSQFLVRSGRIAQRPARPDRRKTGPRRLRVSDRLGRPVRRHGSHDRARSRRRRHLVAIAGSAPHTSLRPRGVSRCTTEFGNVDVSSVPLTFDSSVYEPDGGSDFTLRVGDDLTANGLSDTTKKYLVYYDGPAGGGICGRSASSPTTGGPKRVSFVFLQGDPGCRVGGYGTGNGWPARTAAHELLHALNDYFAARHRTERLRRPRACVRQRGRHPVDGHVAPVAAIAPSRLDVGHDDYYDHSGSWWDIRDSAWLVHLESRAGHALDWRLGHRRGGRVDTRRKLCADACARRYDGGTPVRLVAVEHDGYRLLGWGGACSGLSRTCDTTVESDGRPSPRPSGRRSGSPRTRVARDTSRSSTAFRARGSPRWTSFRVRRLSSGQIPHLVRGSSAGAVSARVRRTCTFA